MLPRHHEVHEPAGRDHGLAAARAESSSSRALAGRSARKGRSARHRPAPAARAGVGVCRASARRRLGRSRADRTMPPPADPQKPGSRHGHGRVAASADDRRVGPTVEPGAGGERIEGTDQPRPVLACVQEHVGESVPHLARGPQHASVIAVGEHRSRPPPRPVERASHAHRQSLDPARERRSPPPLPRACARGSTARSTARAATRIARAPPASLPRAPGTSAPPVDSALRTRSAASRAPDDAPRARAACRAPPTLAPICASVQPLCVCHPTA
jgi:hypothetical protein